MTHIFLSVYGQKKKKSPAANLGHWGGKLLKSHRFSGHGIRKAGTCQPSAAWSPEINLVPIRCWVDRRGKRTKQYNEFNSPLWFR